MLHVVSGGESREDVQDGQSLIRYGERGEKLYLIRSGQVRRDF